MHRAGDTHVVRKKEEARFKPPYMTFMEATNRPQPKNAHVLEVFNVNFLLVLGQRRLQVTVFLYDQLSLGLCASAPCADNPHVASNPCRFVSNWQIQKGRTRIDRQRASVPKTKHKEEGKGICKHTCISTKSALIISSCTSRSAICRSYLPRGMGRR